MEACDETIDALCIAMVLLDDDWAEERSTMTAKSNLQTATLILKRIKRQAATSSVALREVPEGEGRCRDSHY
jgi:hypothetical protein